MAKSSPLRIQAKRELMVQKRATKMAKGKLLKGPRMRRLKIRA